MTKLRLLPLLAGFALVSSNALAADPLDTWQASALTNAAAPSIAFGNGTFLAPGGKVDNIHADARKSTDGISWTSAPFMAQYPASAYGYANGTWVMGTRDGSIYSSTDGTTWTGRYIRPATVPLASAVSVAYGNGRWLVTTGSARAYTSTDAVTWTPTGIVFNGTEQVPVSVAVSPQGTLVACSTMGIASFDGTYWQSRFISPAGGCSVVAANSTGLLTVGAGGIVATSPDGITWTQRAAITVPGVAASNLALRGAAYGSGGWVVVGNAAATSVVFSSPNGLTFTQHVSPSSTLALDSVVFGNGKYVVSGVDAAFAVSAYVSAVYAPPVSLANAPVLTNPKPVVIPTAPTVPVRHL